MHFYSVRVSQAIGATILATVLIVISMLPLRAHELTPAVADLAFEPGQVTLKIELNLEAALARIGAAHDDTDDSPQATQYDTLRKLSSEELEAWLSEDLGRFLGDIMMMTDLGPVTMDLGPVSMPETGDVALARISELVLVGALPDGAKNITFSWSEDFGPIVLRAGDDDDAEAYTAFLSNGDMSEPIPVSNQREQGLWSRVISTIAGFFGDLF